MAALLQWQMTNGKWDLANSICHSPFAICHSPRRSALAGEQTSQPVSEEQGAYDHRDRVLLHEAARVVEDLREVLLAILVDHVPRRLVASRDLGRDVLHGILNGALRVLDQAPRLLAHLLRI